MGIIFINYRRENTAGEARALYNDLAKLLGEDRVFMDVDNIALGQDFRDVLKDRLDDCEVMLVLIGRGWSEVRDGAGLRRIDQPGDFVRLEIATALERKVAVTPVLVQDARIPEPAVLPDDLKALAFRNGFTISHASWDSNVKEMVRRLRLAPRARWGTPLLLGAGAVLIAGGAAGAWYLTQPTADGSLPERAPGVTAAASAATDAASIALATAVPTTAASAVVGTGVSTAVSTAPSTSASAASSSSTAVGPASASRASVAVAGAASSATALPAVAQPAGAMARKPTVPPTPAEAAPKVDAAVPPVAAAPPAAQLGDTPEPQTRVEPAARRPVSGAAPSSRRPQYDVAAIQGLIEALSSEDAAQRDAAATRLQQEYLGSREAVREAVMQLTPENFKRFRSRASRVALFNWMLSTSDAAWTPESRAAARISLKELSALGASGKLAFRPDMQALVDRVAERVSR